MYFAYPIGGGEGISSVDLSGPRGDVVTESHFHTKTSCFLNIEVKPYHYLISCPELSFFSNIITRVWKTPELFEYNCSHVLLKLVMTS